MQVPAAGVFGERATTQRPAEPRSGGDGPSGVVGLYPLLFPTWFLASNDLRNVRDSSEDFGIDV